MTAAVPSPVVVPAPATYRIDRARSSIGYSGKHLFGLGTVHATFTVTEDELRIADPPEASTARATGGKGMAGRYLDLDLDVRAVREG